MTTILNTVQGHACGMQAGAGVEVDGVPHSTPINRISVSDYIRDMLEEDRELLVKLG